MQDFHQRRSLAQPSVQPGLDQITLARSRELHKDLRLRDLVLMQVLLITTETCIGIAGRQGPTHLVFWAIGILFFFAPVSVVVRYLGRVLPWEGGVYQWAKIGLGPFCGFMTAWNFWIYSLLLTSSLGISIAESLAYAGGRSGGWTATSKSLIALVNVLVFAFILVVDIRGFKLGKWVSHVGTAAMLAVQLAVVALLFIRPHHAAAAQPAFAMSLPPLTLLSLNLLTKISFTGLNGGEQVAVFAGEMHTPADNIGRSLWIAAPIIALLYILSTGSLLSYVPAQKVDLAAPVSQTLSAALGGFGSTAWIASAGVTAIIMLSIAQYTVIVAETSRLPLVAGWDGLLPDWFTRLSPRYGTPAHALWFVVLCCFALAMVSLVGVGRQEAFQLVTTAGQACYGLYYAVLFSIALRRRSPLLPAPSYFVRVSAVSGLAITLAAIALQVVPIIDVPHPWIFALKVSATLLLANILGAVIYRRRRR